MKKLDLSNGLIGVSETPLLIIQNAQKVTEQLTEKIETYKRSLEYVQNSTITNKGVICANLTVKIQYGTKKLNYSKEVSEVPFNIIKVFLHKFGEKISREILKGYTYSSPIGSFYIWGRETNFKKQNVNWGESKKLKKAIEDRGGIPFKVLERDKGNNPIKDNGGEEWMMYHTEPFTFWWHWNNKKLSPSILNANMYKFRPTHKYRNKEDNMSKLNRLSYEEKVKRFL